KFLKFVNEIFIKPVRKPRLYSLGIDYRREPSRTVKGWSKIFSSSFVRTKFELERSAALGFSAENGFPFRYLLISIIVLP
ncbi:MAG: hypothetical protein KC643_21110, partial [Nitrospira sp.]|nr:hypothetical protein [Nitrospira sp.]